MGRTGTPFKHVKPPWIVGKMYADMIGYEIEDQPQIMLPECVAQPFETGFAAKFGIELGVVGNVIAMGGALARLHEGRCIEMRDAERLQIGDDGRCGVEIEIR